MGSFMAGPSGNCCALKNCCPYCRWTQVAATPTRRLNRAEKATDPLHARGFSLHLGKYNRGSRRPGQSPPNFRRKIFRTAPRQRCSPPPFDCPSENPHGFEKAPPGRRAFLISMRQGLSLAALSRRAPPLTYSMSDARSGASLGRSRLSPAMTNRSCRFRARVRRVTYSPRRVSMPRQRQGLGRKPSSARPHLISANHDRYIPSPLPDVARFPAGCHPSRPDPLVL